MWLVVGLGNPGPSYANSRHNVGFMVIDLLAERWGVSLQLDAGLRVGLGTVASKSVALIQPQTFMNRSGDALVYFDPKPDDRLVAVYDDLDLPTGVLRVRTRGGSGGHRGVASIMEAIGVAFDRVRVGIGRPSGTTGVADYVLASPTPVESAALCATVALAGDAVQCIITDGTTAAMNRFNGCAAGAA